MLKRSKFAATLLACAAGSLGWTLVGSGQQGSAARAIPLANEWPTYGHDAGGMRYSPLTQLTPGNVAQLQPAWVYHMKPPAAPGAAPADPAAAGPPQGRGGRGGAPGGFASGETTPLVINGTMYVTTPYGRVVALDPTTGKEKWIFPHGHAKLVGKLYSIRLTRKGKLCQRKPLAPI